MLPKNSPCTKATCSQSSIRVNKILVRITSDSFPPNPSMADWIISIHLRAWAPAFPLATVLPSGPSGAVPVTAMIFPLRTAREIPSFGSKGDPVEMCWRDVWLMMTIYSSTLSGPDDTSRVVRTRKLNVKRSGLLPLSINLRRSQQGLKDNTVLFRLFLKPFQLLRCCLWSIDIELYPNFFEANGNIFGNSQRS